MSAVSLSTTTVESIARGTYADPFAVLGPHLVKQNGLSGVAVRAFRPHALSIAIVDRANGRDIPMERLHHEGVFDGFVDGATRDGFEYRLRVTWPDGNETELDDPYRYGPVLTDFDQHLFAEGTHVRAFNRLGARLVTHGGRAGVHFAVWAPSARRVSVVGDFNGWDGRVHPMRTLVPSGLWEIFIPDLGPDQHYKFEVVSPLGHLLLKSDPCGRYFEQPPRTASIVWDPKYEWQDTEWMETRASQGAWLQKPMAVYEVHLGSWRRGENGRYLSYRELADTLVPYVKELGFTHIELLPVMEHPFSGSWGYQVIGFFAPTSRFGKPEDFKYFVDICHREGIGVILDWVPGHFPKDSHGLARFDGTAVYEHQDPRQGEHQDWGTLIFNYGRHEVRSFLLSNALFWIEEFHLDGLRVDAVASMLYLDYSRQEGQWVPNKYGGRENIEAIEFLRDLNTLMGREHPGVAMIAEESTAWPGVTRPVHLGGLGFTHKWNMGWMHDMLSYAEQDPIYRRYHHGKISFSLLYAFSENFILPFSHDEVVHGKRSMLDKMPGDVWQKHATLRALYGYMYTHPGKKLLFMGGEIGQWREWNHDTQLDWEALGDPRHAALQRWVRDVNHTYQWDHALWEVDYDPRGFSWIDVHDHDNSVISFVRYAADPVDASVMLVNFTPIVRHDYHIGVPRAGVYREVLNSDGDIYGGSGVCNREIQAVDVPSHGFPASMTVTLPPLGFVMLKAE
jgi:1,4-alpha-glucan branching enzyme